MSQEETDIKRKKFRTAMFLLCMVVVIYLTAIFREW